MTATSGRIDQPADATIVCPLWPVRLALVAVVLAIYWPALNFGYVRFDDPEYASANTYVQSGLSVEGVQWAFTTRHAANWHPLTWLSLMLDVSLFGDSAPGHHAMNIVLHALNVLLLFSTLRMMTAAPWRSALVAALLAAHPIHVESVAWISERKDVLSLLFGLLAVRAYARYARGRGLLPYGLVALWMALSLMSKPMLVTLPGLLLLLDIWPLHRVSAPAFSAAWWKRMIVLGIEKLPLLVLSIASAAVTMWAQQVHGELQEGRWLTLVERLQNSAIAYVMYVRAMFWPADLACLYPNPLHLGDWHWPLWQPLAAVALLAAITIVGLVLLRRAPFVIVGWLWFVIALVPVIGFVQIGRQIAADRYAYIPFIGLYIVLAWMLGAIAHRARMPAAIGGACVLALIALDVAAHRQVYVWRDSVTLFRHAANVTERNWMMLNNLAGVLADEGKRDEALPLVQQATEICAQCAWVHEHHGEMLMKANRLADAQQAFERALELDPNYAQAHLNMGVLLAQRSQPSAGIAHLRRAVELEPANADSRIRLAAALGVAGQHAEAVEHVEKAMSLDPSRRGEWQAMLEVLRAGAAAGSRGGAQP